MTEMELRKKYVSTIKSWHGRKESNGTHKPIIDIYNNNKPLPRSYKVKYTDSWCATTVSAAAIKAEKETGIKFTSIIPKECSCNYQIQLFQKLGRWEERDSYVPQIGDIIYYDWNDNGVGDDKGSSEHVGVVIEVTSTHIKVEEGNKSDAVGTRTIAINGRYIRGFGKPNYKSLATSSKKKEDPKKDDSKDKKKTDPKKKENTKKTPKKGDKIVLKNASLYKASTSTKASDHITGTYYFWDAKNYNGKTRITTSPKYVGNTKQITGWISACHLK